MAEALAATAGLPPEIARPPDPNGGCMEEALAGRRQRPGWLDAPIPGPPCLAHVYICTAPRSWQLRRLLRPGTVVR